MKYMIGFVTGVAVGGYIVSKMSEPQRNEVAARASSAVRSTAATVTESGVGRAVADNVSKVSNATSDRITGAVDSVGDSVADVVAP